MSAYERFSNKIAIYNTVICDNVDFAQGISLSEFLTLQSSEIFPLLWAYKIVI